MARAYFQIYFSSRRVLLEKLTDAQRGRVLSAVFDYAELGVLPLGLDAQEDIAFETLRVWLDKNKEHYDKKSAQNQENGKKGGRPRKKTAETDENGPEKTEKTQTVFSFKEKEKAKEKEKEKEKDKAVEATHACAREDAPDGAPPLPTPECFFLENGFARQLSPFVRQQLEDYRAAGMEDDLLLYALQEAANNGTGWAYARAILERCRKDGIRTAAENQQRRRPKSSGRNVVVDRAEPSGNNTLAAAAAADRPRRLKRKY